MEPTKPKLSNLSNSVDFSFEPLSEGLGFHPFSDGLPYAPLAKTTSTATTGSMASRSFPSPTSPSIASGSNKLQMGTGAMAAGAPMPVMRQTPRISVPVSSAARAQPRKIGVPQKSANPATPIAKEIIEHDYGFGYLLKRAFAFTLDSFINMGLCLAAFGSVLWKQGLTPEVLSNSGIILLSALFLLMFNWALITAQEVAFNTSIGKRIFGLVFEGSTIALFLRAIFFLPSLGFCGIGLLWGLFDGKKRCWHDWVAGIQPQEISKL